MSERTPLKNPPSSPQKNLDKSKISVPFPLATSTIVPQIEEEVEIVDKEEKLKFLTFLKKFPEVIPISRTNKPKWINYFLKTQENYHNILTGISSIEKDHKTNEDLDFSNHYMDEKTLNPGDFVIVFPNPDHPRYRSSIDFTYNFAETSRILAKILFAPIMTPLAKMKLNILMRSFAKAFKGLNDADKIGKKTKFIQRLLQKSEGKISLNNPNLYSDLKISQKIDKINIKGGFMEERNGKWFRTGETAKDLCTLIRHLVVLKLTKEMGFKTRMFLSNDGDEIYLVLHADEDNVGEMAQDLEMDKEIDISMCNLTCLEPIDSFFRPLRLNSTLKEKWAKEDGLRIEILRLLDEIDYKKISKECSDKFYVDDTKKPDIFDEPPISMVTWKAYKFYLTKVAEKVKDLRSVLLSKESRSNYIDDEEKAQLTHNLKNKKFPRLILDPESPSKQSVVLRKRKEAASQAPNTKVILVKRKEQLTKNYKKIFNVILQETKIQFGSKNFAALWDYLGIESPFEPFTDYFNPGKKVSFRSKFKTMALWKKYEISERGNFSQFPMVDKLKIVRVMMDRVFNLSDLKETGYITYYFLLNDPFYLYERSKFNLFKPLLSDLTEENKKDFSKDTYFKNPKPVSKSWNILSGWGAIMKIPEVPIKDYYGEKIALYYKFFNYFIYQLLCLSPLGVLCFTVSTAANADQYFEDLAATSDNNTTSGNLTNSVNASDYDPAAFENVDTIVQADWVLTIIFGILMAVWSNLFVAFWNPSENKFKIKHGQSETEDDEQVRSKYEGNFKRSMIDDNMNDECDNGSKRLVIQFLGFLLAFVLLTLNVGVIIAMEIFSRKLDHYLEGEDVAYLEMKVAIPSLINYIFISITNDIYYVASKKLTERENHKFASSYQTSFVLKVVFFQIINTVIPFVIFDFIYFIVRDSACGSMTCWSFTNIYFRTFIYCYGVKYIFSTVFPIIQFYYKKLQFMVLRSKTDEKDPYCKINSFIEIERLKFDFAINDELDGTINSYMDLTVNFALNSLFGILYPMSFPTSFGLFFFSLHLKKKVLMNATTRPQPNNAANIGAFKQLLEFIGYLSAITNAAILAGPSDCFPEQQLLAFVLIMLGIFLIRFILESILGEKSEIMIHAEERNKMIVEKTVKSFVQKAGGYKFEKKLPIFKTFGCLLSEKKEKEQTPPVVQPVLKNSAVATTKK